MRDNQLPKSLPRPVGDWEVREVPGRNSGFRSPRAGKKGAYHMPKSLEPGTGRVKEGSGDRLGHCPELVHWKITIPRQLSDI